MTKERSPDRAAGPSWMPMVAAGVVTVGLVLFGVWWHYFELKHYDDSDPETALGEGVIVLCLPGATLVTALVLARVLRRPAHPASWRLVGWGVTVCHLLLAAVVGLAIWWGWSGRINEGDPAYDGAGQLHLRPGSRDGCCATSSTTGGGGGSATATGGSPPGG